jgi:hypothetical protein
MAIKKLSSVEKERLRRIFEQAATRSHAVHEAEWLVGHRCARLTHLKKLVAPASIVAEEEKMVLDALNKLKGAQVNWDSLVNEKNAIAPNTMWWDVMDLLEDDESEETHGN